MTFQSLQNSTCEKRKKVKLIKGRKKIYIKTELNLNNQKINKEPLEETTADSQSPLVTTTSVIKITEETIIRELLPEGEFVHEETTVEDDKDNTVTITREQGVVYEAVEDSDDYVVTKTESSTIVRNGHGEVISSSGDNGKFLT